MTVKNLSTSVVIVGAGPVGLTLAMELVSRGVEVLVVERRKSTAPTMARCNTVAARTMEIFRRLGLASKVRAAGLPDDYPTDILWTTRANGFEIARLKLSSRATRFTDMSVADANWPTPEPVHRASQLLFDGVLFEHARERIGVRFLMETEMQDFTEDAEGVNVRVQPVGGGEPYDIRCQYMVGCDGGRSAIRKRLNVPFHGDDEIYRARISLIRAPWMLDHLKTPKAWMTWFLGPGTVGGMIAIDGRELWLVHVNLPHGQKDFEAIDCDRGIREELSLPPHLQFEVLHRENFIARRRLAERFRVGRVFLCGDAAHIWAPFAGHGMNTGIADAQNLACHLAAVLQGWGSVSLLDCFQHERHPVTNQVSHFVMNKVIEYVEDNIKRTAPEQVDWDNETGAQLRAAMGKKLLEINTPQFNHQGLNFGYYYDQSPIIAYDGERAPPYDMATYTPSTVPGCRLPHFWTRDGRSLYDLMGPWYTLLRFDRSINVDPLLRAAAERRVPMQVLDVENCAQDVYRHALTLARPDQMVAWRGAALPASPLDLVDLIRGVRVGLSPAPRAEAL